MTASDRAGLAAAVDALVDVERSRCLWFLREDYYPATDAERRQVLAAIRKHGRREAFRKAAELEAWLSRISSDVSAGS